MRSLRYEVVAQCVYFIERVMRRRFRQEGFRDSEGTYADQLVKQYEWVEEGKPYREFLIPTAVVNQYGPPRLLSAEEIESIPDPGFPRSPYVRQTPDEP
jgi:hypothetical protein